MNNKLIILAILGFATALLVDIVHSVDCEDDSGADIATYFPHETECGKFYECQNGEAKLFECPAGTYFDSFVDVCSFDVNCGDLLTSTPPPPTDTPTETEPTATPVEPTLTSST